MFKVNIKLVIKLLLLLLLIIIMVYYNEQLIFCYNLVKHAMVNYR